MARDVFDTFEDEVKQRHSEMISELEQISVENIKSEGVTLSFGGKTFRFTDLEIIPDESMEDRIRSEYKDKLNVQQQKIREKINAKINQLLLMHQNKQQEFDRKERALKQKYSEAAMMPDITESHMARGLSVCKGRSNDELLWIYRGVYNPRFIAHVVTAGRRSKRKPIPSRLVNRMKKDIVYIVKTKGNNVTNVATGITNNSGIGIFSHYHYTGSNDCWGSWRWPDRWNNPNDILAIAKNAEAILEVINHGSIASRTPNGLPRLETLLRAVENVEEVTATTVERENGNTSEDDVWQSI